MSGQKKWKMYSDCATAYKTVVTRCPMGFLELYSSYTKQHVVSTAISHEPSITGMHAVSWGGYCIYDITRRINVLQVKILDVNDSNIMTQPGAFQHQP
jgi:hypothetical protein